MPLVRINGIELYYEIHGEGPAVVLAHGAGGNHLSWWQQVPRLSQHFRCVTFDHRGFGSSRDLPDGPGADAFIEDLRQLLDHLGIERTANRMVLQVTTRPRSRAMKQAFYGSLVETLEAVCGIAPSDVVVTFVTNTDEDWSFGFGRAQFLTGEL